MLSALEQTARRALAHRDISWIAELVPARHRDSPQVTRELLASAVAADPSLADKKSFRSAHDAVVKWQDARALYDKALGLYYDPKIRAKYGDAAVEDAWIHPERAYQILIKQTASGEIGPADRDSAQEILQVLAGAQDLAAEQGVAFAREPTTPIPTGAAAQEDAYRELVRASLDGPLSADDRERLMALAGHMAAREEQDTDARAAASTAPPGRPGEYEQLIVKSTNGALGEADAGRLNYLAGQRAIAEGRATAEDLQFEQALDEGVNR